MQDEQPAFMCLCTVLSFLKPEQEVRNYLEII